MPPPVSNNRSHPTSSVPGICGLQEERPPGTEVGPHPWSPGDSIPLDRPARKSLSEGNQPGSAEQPWLRMTLGVCGLRPAPAPAPNVSGEKPAPLPPRRGGGSRGRGGGVEGGANRAPEPGGAPGGGGRGVPVAPLEAPGRVRALCRWPGTPARPAPGQSPSTAPFLPRA